MINLIDLKICDEIRLKFEKLNRNPKYPNFQHRAVIEGLRTIGDVYSFWIENPGLRKSLLLENQSERTIRNKASRGIRAVNNGWYFLTQTGKGKLVEVLSSDILERLNGIVEPKFEGTGQFRTRDVTLNIRGYTPPSWEAVPKKISVLIEEIKISYAQNPLEAAVFAHLGIALIQLFVEGNKRCARLVQDRILSDIGLPPVVIPAGEGTFYFNLLGATAPSYRNGNAAGQREFFNYCASKVNNGLDQILGDLHPNQ